MITGLRPGEKLDEELMTAEEAAASREVRPKVRAVQSAPPPAGPAREDRRGSRPWPARATATAVLDGAARGRPGLHAAPRPASGVTPSGSR